MKQPSQTFVWWLWAHDKNDKNALVYADIGISILMMKNLLQS